MDSCPLDLLSGFDALLAQQDGVIAMIYHHFRTLGRDVVLSLCGVMDGVDFLGPSQVKHLWRVVRRSLPALPHFQQRKMAIPPFQLEGLEDQWEPHFGQLELGYGTTFPVLMARCVKRTHLAICQLLVCHLFLPWRMRFEPLSQTKRLALIHCLPTFFAKLLAHLQQLTLIYFSKSLFGNQNLCSTKVDQLPLFLNALLLLQPINSGASYF